MSEPHFMNEAKKRVDPAVFTAALMDDTVHLLKNIQDLLVLQRGKGQAYTSVITLTGGGATSRIDFVSDAKDENIPNNTVINRPFERAYSIIIRNEGPADVYYSTNTEESNMDATNPLHADETQPISYIYPVIRRINLRAMTTGGATATIRLTAFV